MGEMIIGRRAMLGNLAGVLVALPAGLFFVHCSSENSNSSSNGDSPAGPPMVSGSEIVYTSSLVGSHSHTFGLDSAAIATPPAAGVGGSTSNESGHTHSVSISASELESVNSGESVKITTSSTSGHTHVFTFVKVS